MSPKISFVILLMAILLALPSNGVYWQGTGRGMNRTVIAKIWETLVPDVESRIQWNQLSGLNDVAKSISDKLNDAWDPAWNVVLVSNLG